MKKFPPMNVWRAKPLRGAPSTDAIGVSSSTTGMWHDWQLRCFAGVRAVLPFLKRHLLGQFADDFSLGPTRFRHERVARRAQLRLAHVRGLGRLEARRRPHDGRQPAFDLERPEHRARRRSAPRGDDDIAAGEARRRAEIPIGDLMAQRAGDAVVRKPIGPIAFVCDGQMLEHLALHRR